MARVARKISKTGIYHIMLRGANRAIIFEDIEDREFFIERLKKLKETNKCNLYAYCLMDNHVHILIKESEDNISTCIKRICSSYVYYYNNKYDRLGHLFQERFKSETVETDNYFVTVLRYIHQNPSQAGMPMYVKDSNWTSYNDYIGEAYKIDVSFGLKLFSDNIETAKSMFIKYHKEINDDKCLDYENFIRLTDQEAILEIKKKGIHNISSIKQVEKNNRDYI